MTSLRLKCRLANPSNLKESVCVGGGGGGKKPGVETIISVIKHTSSMVYSFDGACFEALLSR